jgi:xylose isomerase
MSDFISRIGYATRLNSFRGGSSKTNVLDLIKRASKVRGLGFVDLNYPEHVDTFGSRDIGKSLKNCGLTLNSVEMRYNKLKSKFGLLALSSKSARERNEAVNQTLRAIDCLDSLGGSTLTLWPSLEGYDYPYQIDYYNSYTRLVDSLKKICLYNKSINISLEFKPNDLYSYSLIPNLASSIILAKDIGVKNVGLTLDFCHLLMSGESPAASADNAFNKCRVFGIHLNDGYGRRDDGLMVGSIHPIQTLEMLSVIYKNKFSGVIYFDTFPTYIDPVEECERNIKFTNHALKLISTKRTPDIMRTLYSNKIFSKFRK